MTRATGRPRFPLGLQRLPAADECVVWRSPVVRGRWEPFGVLDADERDRYRRFHLPADRARYATAHTVLRLLLGAYLNLAPASLRFVRTCEHCGAQHGKPRLVQSGSIVDFSLSHAGERVLIAIARRPVGVDIEALDSHADATELAEDVLSSAERVWFDQQPEKNRTPAFFTYWTRKEALLKATGHGLRVPMSALTMSQPDQPAALLNWAAKEKLPTPVHLRDLRAERVYRAGVALLGGGPIRVTERGVPQPS